MPLMLSANFQFLGICRVIIGDCVGEMRVQFCNVAGVVKLAAFRMNVEERTRQQSDKNGNDPQQG